MTADLDDLLTRSAARPRTPIDPGHVRDASRRRTRRRRLATGGGAGLAIAAAVAIVVPMLVGEPSPVIDDVAGPPDDEEREVIDLDLPDGWVQARIGDAVFGIPPRVEVVEVAPTDTVPCPNTDRVSTAHLAPQGWSPDGGCRLPGPTVASLVAVPTTAQDGPPPEVDATPVRIGGLEAQRYEDADDAAVDAPWRPNRAYVFDELDLTLRFSALAYDPQLEADVLGTVSPATGPPASVDLPDDLVLDAPTHVTDADGDPDRGATTEPPPADRHPDGTDGTDGTDHPDDRDGTDTEDPGTRVTVGEVAVTVPDGIEVSTGGQQLPCHLDAMVAVLDALTPEPGPECPAAGPSGTLVALVPAERVAPAFRPGEGDAEGAAQVDEVELLGTSGTRETWTGADGAEAQSWWFPDLDLHLEVRGAELTPDLLDDLLASATRR